jgi:geranylgeranyl diphosphate synthase, type II
MTIEARCCAAKSYLTEKQKRIEEHLSSLAPSDDVLCENLLAAARYSLLAPAKRLRPILTLATAKMFGVEEDIAITPACAVEYIHTYSLIHDDLPCMDDDDLRRGKPTLHKVYDEGHAVLAGDFLLTYAFELLTTAPGVDATTKVDMVRTLAQRSGAEGMIGGQVLDIEAENNGDAATLEQLETVHLCKTAALLTAAIEFGGYLGKASDEVMELLRAFGKNVGLAFQIIDDILDVTGDEATIGKPVGSDISNEKTTYVSLLGLERAYEYAEKMCNSAYTTLQELEGHGYDTTILRGITDMILKRDH